MWWNHFLEVNTRLANIERKLDLLIGKDQQMSVDITALTAEVTNNTNVTNSVVQLVQNLATQIKNIPPSNDPATQQALDGLVATLTANDGTIASAVTANTPAST